MAKEHKGMMMFRKILAAVASLILVTGCADASVHVGGRGPGHLVKSTNGSFVGTPGVGATIIYDTSIGSAVDANGFTTLPLRAGASAYFVNSSTGSDANTCTQAKSSATPKATAAAGVACITTGNGDQVLVAQGTSYANFPSFQDKFGFSYLYPTAIRSYDPADPTNTAKYGRAVGSTRPVFGPPALDPSVFSPGNVYVQNFMAFQGLDFNPGGNVPNYGFDFFGAGSGILIENNIFRYEGIGIGTYSGTSASHWVFRNNSIYAGWCSTADDCGGGIYADGSDSITVEDNVLDHNGWKDGASRDDDWSLGGATIHRHALYLQATTNGVVRRNLISQSATISVLRGHETVKENMFIDNPAAFAAGDDNVVSYSVDHPYGEDEEASYNAVLLDADTNTANPLGWGISTTDGRQGDTFIHHNLIVQSRAGLSHAAPTFRTYACAAIPSYADFHDNVSYLWSAPGSVAQAVEDTAGGCSGTGQTHPTYETNKWDATASGSNVQSTAGMFTNAYTVASFYSALGYANEAAFLTYARANPDAHIQRTARALLFAGYGLGATTVTPLNALTLSPTTIANGSAHNVVIFGGNGGSLMSGSGLPAGVTVSKDHLLVADGSTPAGTPSFTVTENDVDGQTHNTTLSLTITGASAPILSSPTGTATGSSTATLGVSTDTGNGTLYWEADPSATPPTAAQIKLGQNSSGTIAAASGSQAVSATGAQSASATALTPSTSFYPYFMHRNSSTVQSAVASGASFTTSAGAAGFSVATSSASWTISGTGNVTGTRSTGGGADGLLRGSVGHSGAGSWSYVVTVTTMPGSGGLQIGVGTAAKATNDWAGDAGGCAYDSGAALYFNATGVQFTTSYTTGDQIKVAYDGTNVTFYKWNGSSFVQQGTPINVSGTITTAYPIISTSGTGAVVNADFTNW